MSDGRLNSDDYLDSCYLASWETEVLQELNGESEKINERLQLENDLATKKLWTSFQNSAQVVAVMYKGAADNQHTLWGPFQTAAGSITTLYKESLECVKRSSELGIQSGYHKRSKELANWARRKRHIKREELLAFLSGKNPPPTRSTLRASPRARLSLGSMSPRHSNVHHPALNSHSNDDNLTTFREALGIPHGHPAVAANTFGNRRRNSAHSPELQTFLNDEFARHKRPAPSSSPNSDVSMDSPQHKRFKFT